MRARCCYCLSFVLDSSNNRPRKSCPGNTSAKTQIRGDAFHGKNNGEDFFGTFGNSMLFASGTAVTMVARKE